MNLWITTMLLSRVEWEGRTCSSLILAPLPSQPVSTPPSDCFLDRHCSLSSPGHLPPILHSPLELPLDRLNFLPVPKPWELSSYLEGIWWLCRAEFVLWKTVFFVWNLSVRTNNEVIRNAVGESFDVPQRLWPNTHSPDSAGVLLARKKDQIVVRFVIGWNYDSSICKHFQFCIYMCIN